MDHNVTIKYSMNNQEQNQRTRLRYKNKEQQEDGGPATTQTEHTPKSLLSL